MDNYGTLLQKASDWMIARGWKQKVAKRRRFEQSLFEHTLVELDVTLQLLPILKQPNHFYLSLEEEQVLIASIIAHDVGKEIEEWQEYILGKREFVSDINQNLTRNVIPNLCATLGFHDLDQKIIKVVENCVNLHMSHERGDANVVSAIFQGEDRWYTLANLVYHIDNFCSAKGIFEAKIALDRSLLGKHLKSTYHQIVIRGVSTTALHRAALEIFEDFGWNSLLHFSDATLYVCSAAQPKSEPTPEKIESKLAEILKDVTGREVMEFMVGDPRHNIMPKPELFEYSEIRMYLEAAAHKVKRKSFLANYENEKKKVSQGRLAVTGRGKSKADVIKNYWKEVGKSGDEYSPEMDRDADRISNAHPEMIVFKFFKVSMKPEMISDEGVIVAREEYEAIFGPDSWVDLLSTSTLMPQRDMAKTVDLFWGLSGEKFDVPVNKIGEMAPESRTDLLIDVLTFISQKVYAAIPNKPSRQTLAQNMAASFVQDLVYPAVQMDVTEFAIQQREFYSISKPFAGKQTKKAHHMCPICNAPFKEGTKASADIIDKPESHTNRGVSHDRFEYILICDACKYERILRQLLMGERAKELIILFPRMNIGHGAGEILVNKTQDLYNRAYMFMIGDTDDPDRRIWLPFTSFIADQILDQDLYRLGPENLIDLLTFRSGENNRKKNIRRLRNELMKAYKNDLERINDEWGEDFDSWDQAVAAVYSNKILDPTARKIRNDVYRLRPQMRLVCQTPHVIMLPLSYNIKLEDDSETNAALRRTFIALILGLSMDASVAIVRDSDPIDFRGGEGVAFVPPVSAARELIGTNWVPLNESERWLRLIGVSSILATIGRYSDRSGLYEVLTSPTAGHVLRRVEQKKASKNLPLTSQDIRYLKIFDKNISIV